MSGFQIHLDTPRVDAAYPPQRFPISGWIGLAAGQEDLLGLEAWVAGECVGRTRHFFERPDVSAHLGLPVGSKTGFLFYGSLPLRADDRGETAGLTIRARTRSGTESASVEVSRIQLRLQPDERAALPYGFLLEPATEHVLHRENIYGSGPSTRTCDAECLAQVLRYLDPARPRVLDVGCGLGMFAEPLLAAGYDWFGVEVKAEDCAELARRQLAHRQVVPGQPLPFADGAFDAAICLEVLEHIEDTAYFLAEIARVVKGPAIFSVPNAELIPLFSFYGVVPWHLLEADHKNFFNRFNLRALLSESFAWVEVFDYKLHPLGQLKQQELPCHLLAVADRSAA